ncbi:unnamed protein product [Cyprideis torosa]|uniref:(S)-2-hydroxy-acid oxidase n=1 Tax=Cyprideis torosa TaxID=163714 RepID=A0A7R8W929_9CRUS|nr:unnamed protein product [Cyprideis torosa]CAG0889338.1 unnamed protein product [Cyprideis torosa]
MSSKGKLVCVDDYEQEASHKLPKMSLDYYSSGADDQWTLRENRLAFKRYTIIPRMLRDVTCIDLSTTVFGRSVSFPIGVAPTAMQKLAHEDGEIGNAKAASRLGTVFILSTISTTSIEDVAQSIPHGVKWFQLYIYKNRDITLELVRRAEEAGFEALVLTVDAPHFGKRRGDIRNNFQLPSHLRMANFQGLSSEGKLVCVDDYEQEASHKLPKMSLDYYSSGADDQWTLRENRLAFKRYTIIPRMLRDVTCIDLSTTVFGRTVSFPIGVAPTAMQKLAHEDGEIGNAKAASRLGTVFILSTISTTSIEDVAQSIPHGVKWFQLYIYKNRDITLELVRRAEEAGFEALVLTVDAPHFGKRRGDIRNNFQLPSHLRMANFQGLSSEVKGVGGSGINQYVSSLFDQSLTWKDIWWLKQATTLPLVLKGILSAEDARIAVEEYHVDGIIVSNHGARQLDGVPAPVDVLSDVCKVVGRKCSVFMDGGVRTGTDVFKALALGAQMVFVGRAMLWGLAVGGEKGAVEVLQILRDELRLAMALAGCSKLSDVNENLVKRAQSSKL